MTHDSFERWCREVRDPASAAAPRRTTLKAEGWAATYLLAPIPGGWAYRAEYSQANGAGGGAPWTAAPTQELAKSAALDLLWSMIRCNPNVAPPARLEQLLIEHDRQPSLLDGAL